MDFSTGSRDGVPIVAISNGKIVKLQSLRYSIGNALYLQHDDGMTSRYGHLSRYSEKILQKLPLVIREMVEKRMDFTYTLNQGIPFGKGEIIGYSGRTGMGPAHLHLELLRDGIHYNPADFGLDYNPQSKINLFHVTLQPEDSFSYINGKQKPIKLPLYKKGDGSYTSPTTAKIQGKVSVKLAGHERSGYSNKIGFRKISTYLNAKELQVIKIARIKKRHQYRSCLLFDNFHSNMSGKPFTYHLHSIANYGLLTHKYPEKGKGIISSEKLTQEKNTLTIDVEGLHSNATVAIKLRKDQSKYPYRADRVKHYTVYPDSYANIRSKNGKVELFFPGYSIFEKANFTVRKSSHIKIPYKELIPLSDAYTISPDYRSYHLGYNIYFYSLAKLPFDKEKVAIYRVNYRGYVISRLESYYSPKKNFAIRYRNRASGNYIVLADLAKPRIRVHRYSDHAKLDKNDKIFLIISDIGSGVRFQDISARIDGEKARVDHDPESGLREVFSPKEKIYQSGKHVLEVEAKDRAGNLSDKLIFHYSIP